MAYFEQELPFVDLGVGAKGEETKGLNVVACVRVPWLWIDAIFGTHLPFSYVMEVCPYCMGVCWIRGCCSLLALFAMVSM